MSDAREDVGVIRQALQGALAPATVSTALFEALGALPSGPPETSKQLLAFVRGPLSSALEKHVTPVRAEALIERIEDALREAGIIEHSGGFSREPTAAVPTEVHPVRVLVVSRGERFAERLELALGPERVQPQATDALHAIVTAASVDTPAVLVVDAEDYPPFAPEQLAEALGHFPPTTAHAVWAADLRYGGSFLQLCRSRGISILGIEQTEGIGPLLDVIRARRRQ